MRHRERCRALSGHQGEPKKNLYFACSLKLANPYTTYNYHSGEESKPLYAQVPTYPQVRRMLKVIRNAYAIKHIMLNDLTVNIEDHYKLYSSSRSFLICSQCACNAARGAAFVGQCQYSPIYDN